MAFEEVKLLFFGFLFCAGVSASFVMAVSRPASRSRSPRTVEDRLAAFEDENAKLKESLMLIRSGRDFDMVQIRAKKLKEDIFGHKGSLARKRMGLIAGLNARKKGMEVKYDEVELKYRGTSGQAPEWLQRFYDTFVSKHELDVSNPQRVTIVHNKILNLYDENLEDYLSMMKTQWGEEYADKLLSASVNDNFNLEILEYSK